MNARPKTRKMDDQTVFAEEIDYRELRLDQIVGRGAFGVVQHGKWRGIHVAVKHIETESEKKAFITELKQLSRVSHRNIVTLYGACTQTPVCLVMEYAEGGSLYNVLHGVDSQPDYTLGHAMSWCYQCSLGVEYLHGMKPRPLIHRDLKPPNLLLVAGGTILKICDFGTACDAQTHMTNNKGSAAWMAPEVFEGSKYSEKCDVFSWGIILWEVVSRRKPFDEIGGPAFRIMWAVHNGTRPPLISNCPKSVQKLMTRCWSANPIERPSMGEVVRIMGMLMPYCVGGDVPLVYPEQLDSDLISSSCVGSTPPYTNPTPGSGGSSTIHDLRDTVRQALYGKGGAGQPVPVQPQTPKVKPVVVEDETTNWRRTSAPASLAASRENLLDKSSRSSTPNVDLFKRYSADLTRLEEVDILAQGAAMGASNKPPKRTHRRTGSHGTPFVFTSTTNANLLSPTWAPPKARGHKRTGSFGNSPFAKSASDLTDAASSLPHAHTVPTSLGGVTSAAGPHVTWSNMSGGVTSAAEVSKVTQEEMLNNMMNIPMDYQLQPLPPCKSNKESMDIYNEHRKLAEEFYRVQVEIMVLQKRNDELEKQLAEDEQEQLSNNQLVEEYQQLVSENENLLLLQKNVMKSIDQWKREQRQQNTLKRTTPPTALTSSDV